MYRIDCERYPCHFTDQDCSLCFCPFYPCLDERTQGRIAEGEWICQDCLVVHRPDVSAMVIDALMDGDELSSIWKRLERLL